jgi:hypothetical protein
MKRTKRDFVEAILTVALAVVGIAAQQAPAPQFAAEGHVKDIKAAQTDQTIFASQLCDLVKANGGHYERQHEVNAATLAPNLFDLLSLSEDVVIAGDPLGFASAISPSGEDVGTYFDVKVLRSFKGHSKVGDILTFGVPRGDVHCEPPPVRSGPFVGAQTLNFDWLGPGSLGPYILFLRHSRADETDLLPGLRLIGGDGFQGFFSVLDRNKRSDCSLGESRLASCLAGLDTIQEPISVRYRRDPLKEKYDGMPAWKFLKEVQSTAESLGDAK